MARALCFVFLVLSLEACSDRIGAGEGSAKAREALSTGERIHQFTDEENPRCLEAGRVQAGRVHCSEYRISIVELLANPREWHGRDVVIIGYAAVGLEHSAIYLHEEDLRQGITSNGLWLELPQGFSSEKLADGSYILARGTFDAKSGGHLGNFNGTIRASKINLWKE